jgi:hypothetical protein
VAAFAVLLLVLGGCASHVARETEVVTMRAEALPQNPGLPPHGGVWRLDERDLARLSPAPYVEPPPPPLAAPYAGVPAVPAPYAWPSPYFGWGVPYYGTAFDFSFGHSHPRHFHRRWRR